MTARTAAGSLLRMAGLPHRLLVEDRAEKSLLDLDPRAYGQLAARIFRLSCDPRPADTHPPSGRPGLWAVDQGKFRIVYAVIDSERLVVVRRVGRRNDDELCRGLR